jgi:hypothetical protein
VCGVLAVVAVASRAVGAIVTVQDYSTIVTRDRQIFQIRENDRSTLPVYLNN